MNTMPSLWLALRCRCNGILHNLLHYLRALKVLRSPTMHRDDYLHTQRENSASPSSAKDPRGQVATGPNEPPFKDDRNAVVTHSRTLSSITIDRQQSMYEYVPSQYLQLVRID